MIFLSNVKIINALNPGSIVTRGSYNYCPPWMKMSDKFDVYKFCLLSYSKVQHLFSKIFINVILDEEYENRKDELYNFCHSIFDNEKLYFQFGRLDYKSDWQKFFENNSFDDDENIFFSGNDDHVFIDTSDELLKNADLLIQKSENIFTSVTYSAFVEVARYYSPKSNLHENKMFFTNKSFDAAFDMQIFSIKKLKYLIFELDYPDDLHIFRLLPLYLYINNTRHYNLFNIQNYYPLKEMVRHIDGNCHVGFYNNVNPFITIPNGFFEKNIEIKYGFKFPDTDYLNVNPKARLLLPVNEILGFDYRWYIGPNNDMNDIPMIFRDSVKNIVYDDNIDFDEMKKRRNYWYNLSTKQKVAFQNNQSHLTLPDEWLSRFYL